MEKYSELTTNQKKNLLLILLFIFVFFTVLSVYVFPFFFNLINYKISDIFFQTRYIIKGAEKTDPHIVHLDLNDTAIEKLNLSEFDRSIYAKAVNVLTEAKARSIAFDIFFAANKEKKNDDMLAASFKKSGSVFLAISPQTIEARDILKPKELTDAQKQYLNKSIIRPKILKKGKPPLATHFILNFDKLSDSAKGFGHISIDPDKDGVYRRIPLFYSYNDGLIPSLTLSMLLDYLEVNEKNIEISFGSYLKIKNVKKDFGIGGDIKIPIDIYGNTIVNFAGIWNDAFLHLSFADILEAENNEQKINELKDDIENNLIIISDVSTHGKDHGTIPIEKVYPRSGLHSNFINSVLTGSMIKETRFFYLILINIVFAVVLWILSIRFKAFGFSGFSFLFLILFVISVFLLFSYAYMIIPISSLIFSFIFSVISVILYRYFAEQKNYIAQILSFNKAASRFVPKEFLHFLNRDDITEIKLGDQIFKKMSVLFSDIRSFTTLSEKMSPKENFDFINSYLSEMGPVIRANNGFIDKYIGDAIMALFPDNPAQSVKAGIEMKRKLTSYNAAEIKKDRSPISIGVGINTGDLMLGIIGENERHEGTVISDTVNLASRLEGLTKFYHASLIISESTFDALDKNDFSCRFIDFVKVKGKNKPVSIYEVLDAEAPEVKEQKVLSVKLLDEAFSLYLKGSFNKALNLYNEALKEFPQEELAKIFKTRCEYFIKTGAPSDWNGSFELTEK